jgi:hypothetical protein
MQWRRRPDGYQHYVSKIVQIVYRAALHTSIAADAAPVPARSAQSDGPSGPITDKTNDTNSL